ncbi:MAG: hypothetical protein H7X93_04505 [Sphingomonadaceae bacterium]|nr:hypothetical protein [Sphingomonadaceae bacterium]
MSDERHESHNHESGLGGITGTVPKLLGGLALGSAAAVAVTFFLSNFARLVNFEADFFGSVLALFRDDSPPEFMAGHPVLVPIAIVFVLIFCVISAITIESMQKKLITYWNTTYTYVTTCSWFTSVLGFLKCLIVTIVYVILTAVQIVVVFLMYLVILVNILAVVVIFGR